MGKVKAGSALARHRARPQIGNARPFACVHARGA